MRRALIIVGKAPESSVTKTRLSPPLAPEQAARLYGAFLQDTAAMALTLEWERTTLIYPPRPGAEATLRALLPDAVHLQPQPGKGLGAALAGAFAGHLGEGFERVVLIGSDNPSLPATIVEAACAGLDDHDLVLGPTADGGYYLVGMARPHLGIFERITWSTDVVYAETLDRVRELGLTVLALPAWYDVDTIVELRRLAAELPALDAEVAPHSRALLDQMMLDRPTLLARLAVPPPHEHNPDEE